MAEPQQVTQADLARAADVLLAYIRDNETSLEEGGPFPVSALEQLLEADAEGRLIPVAAALLVTFNAMTSGELCRQLEWAQLNAISCHEA